MTSSKEKDEWAKTALRLPRDLHGQVHKAARAEDRTFNGQIVAILRAALQQKQEVTQ